MKRNLLMITICLTCFPLASFAYDSRAQGNAAIAILAACSWSQMGKIPRNQIMNYSKQVYSKQYGNPNAVDWNNAITVAQKLDKAKNHGCFR